MANVRRVRREGAKQDRLLRVTSHLQGDLRRTVRLNTSVLLCRFLVTTRLNNVVSASTLVPVEDHVFVGHVTN